MILSYLGWFQLISSMFFVSFGSIFGAFLIYGSRKSKAKLLGFMGLSIILIGFTWWGILLDSLTILLTGTHLDNSFGFFGIMTFTWIPPIAVIMIYIGTELLMPKIKWYLTGIYLVLAVIFEIYLFLDPLHTLTYKYPVVEGEHTMYALFIPGTYLSFFSTIFYTIMLVLGIGFYYKSNRSTGLIKRKFMLLSIAIILFTLASIFTLVITSVIIGLITYVSFICGFWLFYLGLKEESEKIKKIRPKKEVKVKESLFRISKRPDQLTEEEVTIAKEKKICLVCKGKLSGFKLAFICPKCDTLYCENCVRILSDLENACWVCNNPFDESKPTQPYKTGEVLSEKK
ncbi:MAG: hypothetical protein ACFFFB_05940 [Candidatus Heimdallarchaeota archaeon]